MNTNEILEWTAVGLNLTYLILLIREHIACWVFGIVGSLLSIYLFIDAHLYSEAILYGFYVLIGIYGWHHWLKGDDNTAEVKIKKWPIKNHIIFILCTSILAGCLGWYFKSSTDAAEPYADAGSTLFSFLASLMEAHKVLSSWVYWIIINLFSVWLYHSRGLIIYAGLMVLYFVMSIVGFWKWNQRFAAQ